MNNRLILNLIHRFRLRPQRGFALPMAMMIGVVCLVVAATMLIRGQDDQTKVVSQAKTSQAIAAAEAGAAQYVNFLNNNRGLIPYADSAWSTAPTTAQPPSGTSGTSGTPGTSGTSGTLNIASSTNGGSCSAPSSPSPSSTSTSSTTTVTANSSTIATMANTSASTGWQSLSSGQGSYRLISYTPAGVGISGTARLIIEGQSQGNSGNAGKARIAVDIPAQATTETVTSSGSGLNTAAATGVPGLWAEEFGNFNGATQVYANVWDSSTSSSDAMPTAPVSCLPKLPVQLASGIDPEPQANNGNKELYVLTSTPGSVTKVNQSLPDLPNSNVYPGTSTSNANLAKLAYGPNTTITTKPTENALDCSAINAATTTITETKTTGKKTTTVTTTVPAPAFPRSTDQAADGTSAGSAPDTATYVYRCSGKFSTANTGKILLGSKGKQTLIFYVPDMVEANSDANLVPYQDPTTGEFTRSVFYVQKNTQFNGKGNVGDMRDPSAMQFYSYQTSGNDFEMKGNSSFYGFLFARGGTLRGVGTSDMAGAIWMKFIDRAGGNTKIWQAIMDPARLMVTYPTPPNSSSSQVVKYNLSGSPTAWKQVPVE